MIINLLLSHYYIFLTVEYQLDAVSFSERAAHYLGEINALHPFREGNGRAQREFINHLAYRNGYFISWTNVGQKELLQASIESFRQGDNTKFAAFIHDNLRKLPVPASDVAVLSNKKKKIQNHHSS